LTVPNQKDKLEITDGEEHHIANGRDRVYEKIALSERGSTRTVRVSSMSFRAALISWMAQKMMVKMEILANFYGLFYIFFMSMAPHKIWKPTKHPTKTL
jgi:hypothetical protein